MPSIYSRARRFLGVPYSNAAPDFPAEWRLDRFGKYQAIIPDVVLALLCLLLWLVPAGMSELRNADEARYVLIAREWLVRDCAICLSFFGEPYDQKPPLPFLLLGAMLKLTGGEVVTLFMRLPSIALGTAAVLATWRIGRRRLGEVAGLFSALVLMTSMRWMKDVPTTELNVMFAGWLTLSLACWFLRPEGALRPLRALAMWLLLAAAFFTKGPFAIVIVVFVLGAEAAYSRSWRPFRESRFVPGMLLVVGLIALWFAAEWMHYGAEFVRTQVVGESVERFFQGKHRAPHAFYLWRYFRTIMFPWGVFLLPMAFLVWKSPARVPLIVRTAFLGWGLLPMIVLTLASGKREPYPLPLLPGFSLVVGYYLSRFVAVNARMPRVSSAMMWAAIGWCCVLLAGASLAFIYPRICEDHGAFFRAWQIVPAVALFAAFGCVAYWTRRFRADALTPVLSLSAILFLVGLTFTTIVKPSADPAKSSRAFSRELDAILEERSIKSPVGVVDKSAKPEYHVYGRYLATVLDFDRDIVAESRALPEVLILRARDWDAEARVIETLAARGYVLERRMIAARDELLLFTERAQPAETLVETVVHVEPGAPR